MENKYYILSGNFIRERRRQTAFRQTIKNKKINKKGQICAEKTVKSTCLACAVVLFIC
jgi:hypothetical protein